MRARFSTGFGQQQWRWTSPYSWGGQVMQDTIGGALSSLGGEVAVAIGTALVLGLLRLLGFDFFPKFARAFRYLWLLLLWPWRGSVVYLFVDAGNDSAAATLCRRLNESQPRRGASANRRKWYFKPLHEGESFVRWPIARPVVRGVVILLCDVSQLSSSTRRQEAIQKRILHRIGSGGLLILGHDCLYRRCRLDIFTGEFGVTLDRFEAVPMVRYSRTPRGLGLGLPDDFELPDGELVHCDWDEQKLGSQVESLYVSTTAENKEVPVVAHWNHFDGDVYWVNSADSRGGLPPAFGKQDFVDLIAALESLPGGSGP